MTETSRKEQPFDIGWCYEPVEEDEAELCEVLLIGEPEDVTPLHIGITNILEEKTIAIIPVEGVTEADSTHYHFELSFNPGILADLEQISVESDGWSIQAVSAASKDSLYLLWIGDEVITLNPSQPTEIILTGLAAKPGQSIEWYKRGVRVKISWQFDNIEVRSDGSPSPNPSQEYYEYTTKDYEMVKATGQSNIPLFVGFVNCNKVINTKVINTEDETNSLQLRLTNTNYSEDESSNITFKYNENPTDASELQVVLEVGTTETAPWALGTEDEVNGILIQIQGDQWQQNGDPERITVGREVKALRWTFIPKGENVVLTAQDTMLIEFWNIVTSHPTGEANLYLYYKKVEGYKDGKFICQIEKAPVAFDRPKDKKGTVRGVSFAGVGALVKGMIIAWNGKVEDIPGGWYLCNGEEVEDGVTVPDLRASFIVGATMNKADHFEYNLGDYYGNKAMMVRLTAEQLPPHSDAHQIQRAGMHHHKVYMSVEELKRIGEDMETEPQEEVSYYIEPSGDNVRNTYARRFKNQAEYELELLSSSEPAYERYYNDNGSIMTNETRITRGTKEEGDHSHQITDSTAADVTPISLNPWCYALCYIIYLGR